MKKMLVGLITAAVLIVTISTSPTLAGSGDYAYSIGVDHSFWDDHSGDFTENVNYAAKAYGMMSSVDASYKNYNPTVTYMREDGPNGIRRICNNVVFLNGHANYDNLIFSQDSKGDDYMTGVYYGDDFDSSSSGIKYVGVTDSDTDMSSVDLISFVGCKTAKGSTNLTSRAYDEGANTAVGFTESINSRNTDGPDWLRKYNDSLANGNSVETAINYATTLYPSSNLGDYAKIYGSDGNTIAYTERNTAYASDVSIVEPVQYDINIVQNFDEIDDLVDVSLVDYKKNFEDLIDELKKIDREFNIKEYRLTVNMYSPEQGNGLIKFTYYFDDTIKTNKVYIAIVENNIVTQINESYINSGFSSTSRVNEIDKNDKVSKVSKFIEKTGKKAYRKVRGTHSVESMFLYDYNTDELKYVETEYMVLGDLDGVIVPVTEEVVID